MTETPAQRALTAATLALAVALVGIAMFLPPLAARTLDSVLRTVVTAVVLVAALLLHWIFLGIASHRMGRSTGGWVGLSLLLFPIGSVASLVLLSWFTHENPASAPAAHHG